MARFSRPRMRTARRNKDRLWTAVLVYDELVPATASDDHIVEPADWVSEPNLRRATLLAVRGWIAMGHTSDQSTSAFYMIHVVDEDAAASDAVLVSNYVDEDVLWTGGCIFKGQLTQVGSGRHQYLAVDCKARRRITSGMQVRLAYSASNASAVLHTFVLRALLQGLTSCDFA